MIICRTHNLNIANRVPDIFMERVENHWQWSLFILKKVPHLVDLYGDDFRGYTRWPRVKAPLKSRYLRGLSTAA